MPYRIEKQGSKWCVIGKDDGKNKGCSDSESMAQAHMRALYANAGGKALEDWLQDDSSLDEVTRVAVEGSIAYLKNIGDMSNIVYHTITEVDTETVMKTTRMESDEYVSTDTDTETTHRTYDHVVQRLGVKEKSWWSNVIDKFKGVDNQVNCISAYKQADGRVRVIMRVSNMFKDRHGEIITSEAHKEYVAWVDDRPKERMPEFWLWHTKGTKWGRADWLDYDDSGFLITSGLVDEDKEFVAERLAQAGNDIGVSHGFYGLSVQGKGFIDLYRSFEFSPLPKEQAANVWTAMMMVKEAELPISEAKRKFFIDDLGFPEAEIQRVEAENKSEADAIKALGVEYKADEQAGDSTTDSAVTTTDSAPGAPTLTDVMNAINGLGERLTVVEEKQKAKSTEDVVADALEAAIKSGKGFVASEKNTTTAEDGKSTETPFSLADLAFGRVS